jgi:hypothetical protein
MIPITENVQNRKILRDGKYTNDCQMLEEGRKSESEPIIRVFLD